MVVFGRLSEPMERSQIKLVETPYWLKIGPCPSKCDKKDLMHAMSSTFGVVMRYEIKGDFYRLCVSLNVQKPLL